MHNQNIRQLAINLYIYKNFNHFSREIIKEIFQLRDEVPCNLRQISVSHPLYAYRLMIQKLLNFLHQKYENSDLMKQSSCRFIGSSVKQWSLHPAFVDYANFIITLRFFLLRFAVLTVALFVTKLTLNFCFILLF